MVRDPSIVSPSLAGVLIGGGHNKHGTGSRCTLPKQCRPPSPRRGWRCDRSSYKRSLVSRIWDSLAHYLTGPETAETASHHPSGFAWGRTTPGWASPLSYFSFTLSLFLGSITLSPFLPQSCLRSRCSVCVALLDLVCCVHGKAPESSRMRQRISRRPLSAPSRGSTFHAITVA